MADAGTLRERRKTRLGRYCEAQLESLAWLERQADAMWPKIVKLEAIEARTPEQDADLSEMINSYAQMIGQIVSYQKSIGGKYGR